MKILVDFHHAALAESILLLFQDRYGVDVYFPAGIEWFDSNIWQFEKAWYGDKFARRYLVDMWSGAIESDGVFIKQDDRYYNRAINGISLDAARNIGIDIVISTLPHNDVGFHAFASQVNARFGVQVGNVGQNSRWDLASFIMLSSAIPGYEDINQWGKPFIWKDKDSIIYHQEFDAKNTFYNDTTSAISSNIISSFVTRMPEHSPTDYQLFKHIANKNNDFAWRVYGSYGECEKDEFFAGDISRSTDIANAMRSSRIGIHIKSLSDGFGHVIHNWAAVGRPILWVKHFYSGTLASALWEDGITSWSIETMKQEKIAQVIAELRDDNDMWIDTSNRIRKRFNEVISFDDEAEAIAKMLGIR